MDTLIRKRGVTKGHITRIRTFLETITPETVDIDQIQGRLNSLDTQWTNFEIIQDQIEELITPEELVNQEQFRVEFENIFFEVKARCLQLMKGPAATNRPQPGRTETQVKLPQIELPQFSGNYTEWYSFNELFNVLIDQNNSLQETQKLQYLRSCLKGEALGIISNLPITTENYPRARELLKNRYDNRVRIANSHYTKLLSQPSLQTESASSIRKLLDNYNQQALALQALEAATWDRLMVHILVEKLDSETRRHWEMSLRGDLDPSIAQLIQLLERRCQALESLPGRPDPRLPKEGAQRSYQGKPSRSLLINNTGDHCCAICRQYHRIYQCDAFKKLSVLERRNQIKKHNLCFNCFRSHQVRNCQASTCRKCQERHHTLLHIEKQNGVPVPENTRVTSLNPEAPVFSGVCMLRPIQTLLPTAVVDASKSGKRWVEARTLVDSGSQSNFITYGLVRKLQLPEIHSQTPLTGLGNTKAVQSSSSVTLTIRSHHTEYRKKIKALVLPQITDVHPNQPYRWQDYTHLQQLTLADPECNMPKEIDLLVGAQVALEINTGVIARSVKEPIAIPSKLGWLVGGDCEISEEAVLHSFLIRPQEVNIERFWEVEEAPEILMWSREERECEQHFVETYKRQGDGRFIVRLPFKAGGPKLGMSRDQAIRRLLTLEQRLLKCPQRRIEYNAFLQEYEDLGHLIEVDPPVEHTLNSHCYLPHHGVVKESSTTTHLRVVFDASSPTSNRLTLNQQLATGPQTQQKLFEILLRFRKHLCPLMGDIEKMYRQIKVHDADQPFQRIVWRKDIHSPIRDLQLTTVTYGMTPAPYLATRVLQQLAKDERDEFPEASLSLEEDTYVDDCLTGTDSIQTMLQLKDELQVLAARGGFYLRKWKSTLINPKESGSVPIIHDSDMAITTALGQVWNPSTDEFGFPSYSPLRQFVSKRHVLQCVAKIFDPLGLLSPITISLKIFMQCLWEHKLDWDQPLDTELTAQWNELQNSLISLNQIKVDRCLRLTDSKNLELQGFCDASEKAYGAVIYLRSQLNDQEFSSRLICAKTRVAPLKKCSLPRLELCAAVLLAQLINTATIALKMNIRETHLWSDSTITLAWISSETTRWSTFIANRVSKIQTFTADCAWHHVKGCENPADVASRGCSSSDLLNHKEWWQGPKWLQGPICYETQQHYTNQEQRIKIHSLVSRPEVEMKHFIRFSSLNRLMRITAWMRRFIRKELRVVQEHPHLTSTELASTLTLLIRLAQRDSFEEIELLNSSKPIRRNSRILSLNPFMDQQGVLRVGGRLSAAALTYDQQHPVILDSKHPLTKLIIKAEHLQHLHAGPALLQAVLRRRFWILRLRNQIKECIKECLPCWKARPSAGEQLMGDLPSARVNEVSRPFFHCGVDYAGPLLTRMRVSRGRPITSKAYIALFICLTTRAIHLELVSDISTEGFLATFRRFISRRGKPAVMYSDQGTQFIGTRRYLQSVQTFCHNEGVKWMFNPPSAPHCGGIWEAGVRSTKTHLRRVLSNALLTFEQLYTVLTQIEACLNSRPLCKNPDPNEPNPLTPGHFLIGAPLTMLPEGTAVVGPPSLQARWSTIQNIVKHFWNRWSSEYLHTLQQRTKWKEIKVNLKLDDIVLIKEDNLPPATWTLGRVIEVHPGRDQHVRCVKVKTRNGDLIRPIQKLCLLPN